MCTCNVWAIQWQTFLFIVISVRDYTQTFLFACIWICSLVRVWSRCLYSLPFIIDLVSVFTSRQLFWFLHVGFNLISVLLSSCCSLSQTCSLWPWSLSVWGMLLLTRCHAGFWTCVQQPAHCLYCAGEVAESCWCINSSPSTSTLRPLHLHGLWTSASGGAARQRRSRLRTFLSPCSAAEDDDTAAAGLLTRLGASASDRPTDWLTGGRPPVAGQLLLETLTSD